MKKPRILRDYEIKRDANGLPVALYWRGDIELPPKRSKAECDWARDAMLLAQWEDLYGKRTV